MKQEFTNEQERSDAIFEIFRLRKLRVKLISAINERNRSLRGLESRFEEILRKKNKEIGRVKKNAQMNRLITMMEMMSAQKGRVIKLYEDQARRIKSMAAVPTASSVMDNSCKIYAPAPLSPIDLDNNGCCDIDVESRLTEFYGRDSV